ncbi:MAG: HD domain-containing protein, partial [Lacipirellulaceae bacterium]
QIAWQAAQLLYDRQESEYYQAKMKAARRIFQGWVKPADLPSNAEIRDQVQLLTRLYERESREEKLFAMRLAALEMMRRLEAFRPKLIGSVLTGHVRHGSDIDLHVFSHTVEAVTHALDAENFHYDVERKQVRKQGEVQIFVHVHLFHQFPFELTVYSPEKVSYGFKSSITGKAIDRATLPELRMFLSQEYPDCNLEEVVSEMAEGIDRFQVFEALLLPCENVKQPVQWHPEGDVLYHSLQVFDLACKELPYDEEFLTAALLHDVGKSIDPQDHVVAGMEVISEHVTDRTLWLVEHHMLAHKVYDGTIGKRARRRLTDAEDFEELMLLEKCDRLGRLPGAETSTLEEALDYLRELASMCG